MSASDDPKIVLDPPPTGTFPVDVIPDSGPAPVELAPQVTLDPPPFPPRDVNVSPDGPPSGPFPVSTSPDAPPWTPVAPSITFDPGPAQPTAPPTSFDSGPLGPIPVDVSIDLGPAIPTPVGVTLDPVPNLPIPIQTSPDDPVGSPLWPGGPNGLLLPFPPGVKHDPPLDPSPPAVRDHRVPRYEAPPEPTAASIAAEVRRFDKHLADFLLNGIGANESTLDRIEGGIPYSRALDPKFLFQWYVDHVDMAKFVAEQGILYAMNDIGSKIFDPLYFVAMSVPGSMGHFPTTVDGAARLALGSSAIESKEVALKTKNAFQRDSDLNAYGPDGASEHGLDFSAADIVDSILDGQTANLSKRSSVLGVQGTGEGNTPQVFDSTKYFEPRDHFGGMKTQSRMNTLAHLDRGAPSKLERSAATNGIIRARVQGESDDGAVYTAGSQDPRNTVDDDDAYLPLSFTDLRKDPITNKWRSVYFQAMGLTFTESFAPEFNEQGAFGRTDKVLNYVSTARSVSLSWMVTAMVPEDLRTIYNKMLWLVSMVYPSYNHDGTFQSGPVVRLRIGDVVASESGGLPGVIKSLSFDFADALWELKKGFKVPRSYHVTAEFTILHDGPVGTLDGTFGVLQLPSIGRAPQADTNMVARDNGTPTNPTVLTGRFTGFGEPVRRG